MLNITLKNRIIRIKINKFKDLQKGFLPPQSVNETKVLIRLG